MLLVFIHGAPAVGKLTVARELAGLTGFHLFHNHLTVDLVSSLFAFGTPSFVSLREQIWLAAFAEAARADRSLNLYLQSGAYCYGRVYSEYD